MIFKTLNSTTIKNPNYKKFFNLKTQYSIIDNQLIPKRGNSRHLDIMRATKKLSINSYATFVSGETSSDKDAMNLLNALGCTISSQEAEFSLIDSQTDKTKMTNPNIIDTKSLKKVKNEQIKGTSSFPSAADPIYKLDDNIPRQIEVQNQESKNKLGSGTVIALASDLAKVNLGTSSRSSKYFEVAIGNEGGATD
jgi:hypothetical protein